MGAAPGGVPCGRSPGVGLAGSGLKGQPAPEPAHGAVQLAQGPVNVAQPVPFFYQLDLVAQRAPRTPPVLGVAEPDGDCPAALRARHLHVGPQEVGHCFPLGLGARWESALAAAVLDALPVRLLRSTWDAARAARRLVLRPLAIENSFHEVLPMRQHVANLQQGLFHMSNDVASQQQKEGDMGRVAHFDGQAFYAALDAHRQSQGLSWRQVADQAGVSASTLTRMAQGRLPDVEGLTALVHWANLDLDDFIRAEGKHPKEPETLARIATYLRSDKHLSPESAKALEEIIRVAYQQFRTKDQDGLPAGL